MSEPDALFATLPPRPWVRRLTLAGFGLFVLGMAGLIQFSSMTASIAIALPATPDLATLPVSVEVTDRNGQLLRPFTTANGRWRLPVDRSQVDPQFLAMLIAYEDRSFAEHGGIAWSSMLRAAGQFAAAGGHGGELDQPGHAEDKQREAGND